MFLSPCHYQLVTYILHFAAALFAEFTDTEFCSIRYFVQIEEESLGRLFHLLNALPDHPLKKNEILDIFYNGLTNASRDHLDSLCIVSSLEALLVENLFCILSVVFRGG